MSELSVSKMNVVNIVSESKAKEVRDAVSKKPKHGAEVSFVQLLVQHSDVPDVKYGATFGKKRKNDSGRSVSLNDSRKGSDSALVSNGTDPHRQQNRDITGPLPGNLTEKAVAANVQSGGLSELESVANAVSGSDNSIIPDSHAGQTATAMANGKVPGGSGIDANVKRLVVEPSPSDQSLLNLADPMVQKANANSLQTRTGISFATPMEALGSSPQFSRQDFPKGRKLVTTSLVNRYPADGLKAGSTGVAVNSLHKKEGGIVEKQSAVDFTRVIQPDIGEVGFGGSLLGVTNSLSQISAQEVLPGNPGRLDISHLSEAISRPLVGGAGLYRVSVSLHPVELGQVSALLTLDKNNLTVTITSQTQAGHQALSESIKHLEQSLSNSGLRVTVTLADSGSNREDQGWSARGSSTGNVPASGAEVSQAVEGYSKELGQIHIVL